MTLLPKTSFSKDICINSSTTNPGMSDESEEVTFIKVEYYKINRHIIKFQLCKYLHRKIFSKSQRRIYLHIDITGFYQRVGGLFLWMVLPKNEMKLQNLTFFDFFIRPLSLVLLFLVEIRHLWILSCRLLRWYSFYLDTTRVLTWHAFFFKC